MAGPNVYICERCIDDAGRLAAHDAGEPTHASLKVVDQHRSASCSLCQKQRADVDRLMAGPGARICTTCLALCREIEEEERTTLGLDRP
jgi:ATP-dependent protease Clp ATPase subunit